MVRACVCVCLRCGYDWFYGAYSIFCAAKIQVGIDIGFHVQSFLSKADMGVRMTGGNVGIMGDMVRETTSARYKETFSGFACGGGEKWCRA